VQRCGVLCVHARAHFAIRRGYRYCRDLLPVQTIILLYYNRYCATGLHLFVLPYRGTNNRNIYNGFIRLPLPIYIYRALYKIYFVISITIGVIL